MFASRLRGCLLLTLVACAACNTTEGSSSLLGPEQGSLFAKPVSELPDPTITWLLPLDDAALAFRSDRQRSDGTYSAYANGVCGLTTWVEMSSTDPFPGFGHLSGAHAAGSSGKGQCARSLTVFFPDGTTESAGGITQRNLTQPRIERGATVLSTLAILSATSTGRCGRLLFGQGGNGAGVGSDSILVTRSIDGASWHVRSNSDTDGTPKNLALCENTNQLFHMPVDFVIRADDPSRFP